LHISKTALKIPVVLGLENKDKYLGRMINTYGAIEYANHHLSDSSLVLFIGTRGYYFKIPFIMAQDYNRYVYNEFCTPQDFLKRLKELKVTHLLLDLYNDNIHTREIRRLLESNKDFLKPENFVLLYQGSDTFFYEVRY
jgi:hypothetical protein